MARLCLGRRLKKAWEGARVLAKNKSQKSPGKIKLIKKKGNPRPVSRQENNPTIKEKKKNLTK